MSGAAMATAAVELMTAAVEHGWFEKLRHALRKRHRIVVLGSTGVGKTNLLRAITNPLPDAIDAINRSDFAKKHRLAITNQPFEFVDTPGQVLHQGRMKDAIRDILKRKGKPGIISVNCYGYHEYGVGRQGALKANDEPDESYLETHRKLEIDYAKLWIPLIGDPSASRFLVNIVSKADLWWDKADSVLEYYRSGQYFASLGTAQALTPATVGFCSVAHRFFKRGALSSNFEDSIRKGLRAHLFQTLLEAVGK